MERTKKVGVIVKPSWKKVGGGSLRIGNRIIKPGQIFEAFPEEISPSFRTMVIPVSADAVFKPEAQDGEVQTDVKAENVAKVINSLRPRGESKAWFDVVNAEGKPMNEKVLKKEVAEKLIEDLNK